jgi:hypothetical protein
MKLKHGCNDLRVSLEYPPVTRKNWREVGENRRTKLRPKIDWSSRLVLLVPVRVMEASCFCFAAASPRVVWSRVGD